MRINIQSILFIIAISLFMNSCASLSKKQCLKGDWNSIGLSDGKKGYEIDRISKHKTACNEFDILVDKRTYEKGWWQGIIHYCVPENGYSLGTAATPYNPVCRGKLENGFLVGYIEGLETALRNTMWKYQTERNELLLYTSKITHIKDQEAREKLKKEIQEHEEELEKLEKKINDIHSFQSTARRMQLSSGF